MQRGGHTLVDPSLPLGMTDCGCRESVRDGKKLNVNNAEKKTRIPIFISVNSVSLVVEDSAVGSTHNRRDLEL